MRLENGIGYFQMERQRQNRIKIMMDWRLQGQEKYLKGVSLYRKLYEPYRAGWDHDHCEFCGTKLSRTEEEAQREGYVTSDNYHWICINCYEDFKNIFEWRVSE